LKYAKARQSSISTGFGIGNARLASRIQEIDNNIGLQLADFIPNPVARHFQGEDQRELNIFTEIKNKSYNGNIDRNDRFGLKKVL